MALTRAMADGMEAPCPKCERPFKQGALKIKRPSSKSIGPAVFTTGGKPYIWVHENCSPTRTGRHGTGAKKR